MIEDQKPVPNPDINTGDLVLVKDHTLKTFMPKYKTDFHVIRVLGNKVEVICQLPDYDAFGRVGRLSFNPE